MMLRQTDRVHQFLAEIVKPGETVVDATAGNGHDTLYLAKLVGPTGRVIAFDIQADAIAKTKALLDSHQLTAELIHDSHANVDHYLNSPIAAATFNLGYLPGADHSITTKADSTVLALNSLAKLVRPGGVVTIICYVGHVEGQHETAAVTGFAWSLDPREWTIDWVIEKAELAPRLCILKRYFAKS